MSSRLTYANAAAHLAEWVIDNGGDGKAIDYFVAHVAEGHGIPEFCTANALMWGVLAGWIRNDPDRNTRYQQAMLDRGAFRKEKLLDLWWEKARATPPDAPSHGDVHKAQEAIAKAEGIFNDKLNIQHSGDVQVNIRRFTPEPTKEST